MNIHKIKRGYNIPISGAAEFSLKDAPAPRMAGVHPVEFSGVKPKLTVKVGDSVKIGTPLFIDKRNPGVKFCSPVAGLIQDIQFGPRRIIKAIRISVSGEDFEQHPGYRPDQIRSIPRDKLIEDLLNGGLWPCLRSRPFNRIADPEIEPSSVFINCMDTSPLAADPEFSMQNRQAELQAGIEVLGVLTSRPIHLIIDANRTDSPFLRLQGVEKHGFTGKHPAGLVGTHIHAIDPLLQPEKRVWHLTAQDLARLGEFILVGRYPNTRTIALAGTGLSERLYYRMNSGMCIGELIENRLIGGEVRLISGNVLTGRRIGMEDYPGFYDNLITVLPENPERKFLGWLLPGFRRPTFSRTFLSAFIPGDTEELTTRLNGEQRSLVQTGIYERVVALDILPDFLIKAILTEDIDLMERLGILECDPEDFALCSYICPSKTEFTEIIQKGLSIMEHEIS